jgi:gliding motility-associated-like protein
MFTFLSMNILVFSQNYPLNAANNNTTISTCGGNFYDSGGATGQYTNNQNRTITFCPNTPGAMIRLNFTAFALENSFDFLYIYNGTSTAAPLLGTYTGTNNPGVVTANNPSGCITIRFTSDGSVLANGWAAAISCIAQGTCTDGIQNQGENGIDCGGPCAACPPIPCNVNLTYTSVPANLTCAGGSVSLTAVGLGTNNLAMNNNFNGGSLGSGWIATGGQSVGTLCGPSLDGTPYYWASTAGSSVPQLTTAVLNVSCGGIISFDMDYATQGANAPCEGPDLPNEGVTFQYSTNGGATWTVIQYWNPLGGYNAGLTNWNTYSFPIPPGAIGPNTQFQWIQLSSSGSLYDNWGIDNVQISSVINCNAYWYDYSFLPPTSDNAVQTTNITSTTTFNVTYTNGIDACNTSVTVVVPPGTTANAGPDKVRCSGGAGVVIGANPVSPDNGATYSWSAGAGSGTIDLIPAGGTTTGQVTVSPLVTTTYTLSVTFNGCTVTDQVTVVVDNPPTASNPAPITLTCASAIPAPDINVVTTESDDITIPPTVTWISDVSNGGICPNIVTRTYRVTDGCGNFVNVTQTITVSDLIAPTVTGTLTAATLSGCSATSVPAAVTTVAALEAMGVAIADNCTADASLTVTSSDGAPTGTCPIVIIRTYTIKDACLNAITVNQTINITDLIVPTASNPVDISVAAGTAPAPNILLVIDEADNCSIPIVAWVSDVSNGGTCPEIITRTYSVTDACLNQILLTQTITVGDAILPTASNPSALNVQCSALVPLPDVLVVTDEADNGVTPTVTWQDDVSNGLTCPEIITRRYLVTDDCGNFIFVTQTITVLDTQAPVFVAPPSAVTVACLADVPAMTNLGYTDNCDPAGSVAGTDGALVGGACGGTITRTWSFTDLCGNTSSTTQTITVDDNTLPTASNPATITVPGGPAPAVDVTVVIDEADNCSVPAVAFVSESTDGAACPETITRIYAVTDACGNTINVTHTILITDPFSPTASNPAPISVECIADVPAQNIAVVTDEADNQGIPVVAWVSDVSNGATCPEIIIRTYSVTDLCNNQILVTQTITVNDVTAPTGTAPANVTVECINDVPPVPLAVTFVITDAMDNCTAVPALDWVGDVSDGNTCPETITRTFSITDDCGNQTLVDQLIIVNDLTAPTASNPGSVNVECVLDVPVADITVVTNEADNCTNAPLVAWVSDVSDNGTCPETITRTYSVTDDCGNQTLLTQTIIVNDVTNPTATNPVAISVVSAATVPVPDPTVVIDEADNCTTNPIVVWVSDVSNGNVCNNEQITRTYSVTDDCGNSIIVTQLITITAIYPTISAGVDQTVCENESVTLSATYSPSATVISWTAPVVDGVSFTPQVGTNTYTLTANNYGCIATDNLTIVVNPIPSVSFTPDVTEGCEPLSVFFTNTSTSGLALTNCVWTMGDGTVLNGCGDINYTYNNPGIFTVGLTSTDANGCTNSVSYQNLIYVEDYPVADFTASEFNLSNLLNETEVNFTNQSSGAVTYLWTFGDGGNSTETNPSHLFETDLAGSYAVMLVAYSDLGCTDTAYQSFTVTEELIFYVPNTFTPDNDVYNNTFQPVFTSGFDPYNFTMLIYNRWGEIIFETRDASIGWDGTYNGDYAQDGIYTWKIEFKSRVNDKKYVKVGHVNMMR